ncbi:MAG: hypothetical protein ACE1ZD_05690 [Dehalococcoidia bacterium]
MCVGKSGGDRGKHVWLTLGGLPACPDGIGTTAAATVREGPGEVSRGHSSPRGRDEGPNLLLQGGSREDLSLLEWRKETVHHGQDSRWSLLLSSDASVLMRTRATSRSQIDPLLATLPE